MNNNFRNSKAEMLLDCRLEISRSSMFAAQEPYLVQEGEKRGSQCKQKKKVEYWKSEEEEAARGGEEKEKKSQKRR